MSDASILVARPHAPAALVLLAHGVGASADDLLPLAQAIARARPQAMVVSMDAPDAFDMGGAVAMAGRQWFSLQGITEASRPARVAAALPAFARMVRQWQQEGGLAARQTTLVGFSQGAIMALESTQDGPPPAARVVAIAGRLAQPLREAPRDVAFHLIHGEDDAVIAARESMDAAAALRGRGARATLDIVPALGHGIDTRVTARVLDYLAAD
jgi:phospholipase/carboxylesterase